MRTAVLTLTGTLFLALGAGAGDGTITRKQLTQVLQSAQLKLRDVEFLYEGRIKRLRAPDTSLVPPQLRRNESSVDSLSGFYQGTFAYRRDQAAHLDLYVQRE